jgi:hypothetical protein
LFYPFTILEIYHLQSHFEPNKIFFLKETLTRITPYTMGQIIDFLLEKEEDKNGINCKKKAKNKSPTFEGKLKERTHRLGGILENFEEGYVKAIKKNTKLQT